VFADERLGVRTEFIGDVSWQERERRISDRPRDLQYLSPLEPPWRIPRRYRHLAPAERSRTGS